MKKLTVLFLLNFHLLSAQMPPICFLPTTSYTTNPSYCIDLASEDFNGDGFLDIVGSDIGTDRIILMLGDGTGSFSLQPSTNFLTGAYPKQLVVGDFNSDTKMDVVTVNTNSNSISVLLGTGTGSFLPQTTYSVPNFPKAITKGDFNNDGFLDLATGNYLGGNISILIGLGNGTFSSIVNYAAVSGVEAITCGDYDHDGKLDLATANWTSAYILVYYGNGNGTFQAAINCPTFTFNNYAASIVSADFNHDNFDDIVVSDALSYSLTAFFGTSTHTMSPYVVVGSSIGSFNRIAAADINGDGHKDIITPFSTFLLGTGTGTFITQTSYTTLGGSSAPIIKDFNSDGKPDLALMSGSGNALHIALNGPIITTSPIPSFICLGHTLTLQAYGATTYTWNAGPTINSSVSVSPTITTTYSVIATNSLGCVNKSTITVSVNANPSAADLAFMNIVSTNPATICAGTTVSVCVNGAANYTWSTGSNSACVLETPTISTNYTVNALSSNGCYKNMSYFQTVDACAGLNELSERNGLHTIFPNPSTEQVHINLFFAAEIMITNALGEIIIDQKYNEGKQTIDLSNCSDGVYFIVIKGNNNVETKKIILQR